MHGAGCAGSPGRACTWTAPRGRSWSREFSNRSIYWTLRHYHELSGIPSIINTSFNMHEEPIVCTPAEAVKAFQSAHLDVLAMGEFIAINPSPEARHQRLAAASA